MTGFVKLFARCLWLSFSSLGLRSGARWPVRTGVVVRVGVSDIEFDFRPRDFRDPSEGRHRRFADIGLPISCSVSVFGKFMAVLASDTAVETSGMSYSSLAVQVRSGILSDGIDVGRELLFTRDRVLWSPSRS